MGKASSSKKVARAARAGGGRAYDPQRPVGWYGAMAVVVLVGLLVLGLSVQQHKDEQAALVTRVPPYEQGSERKPEGDHWHVVYAVFACGDFLPPLEDNGRDPEGIHTHGDGVIHIHPFNRRSAGENATVGVFEETMTGTRFDEDEIRYAGKTFVEGEDECSGEPGVVKTFVNGEEVEGDPSDIKPNDRDQIVFAFVPEGTDEVPEIPWVDALDNLNDVVQSPAQTSTTVAGDQSTSTTAGDAPSTTAGGESTDTTAGGSPSTTGG